jgi:hypothetical protein
MIRSQAPSLAHTFFIGMIPRISEQLLEKGQARYARDKASRSGALEPLYEKLKLADASDASSLFVRDCCMVQFSECATFAEGDQLCEEFYATGLDSYALEGRIAEDCSITWRRLGIPCPENTLSVSGGGGASETAEPRAYAYSYVNSAGREGQLSPGSNVVIVENGSSVSVSGWAQPSPEWDVVAVRIYRAVGGALSDFASKGTSLDVNEQDAAWMYVGEANVYAGSFSDSRLAEELSEAAVIEDLPPPPEWLSGIVSFRAANILAGFVGRTVYFSKNNNPDAWPHYFVLEDNIRGLAVSGNLLYISTDGHPYVMEGIVNCAQSGLRQVLRALESAPAANLMPRAITAVPGGAIYPAYDGLTYIAGNGQVVNITNQYYSAEEWGQLLPNTMIPIWHQGKIYLFGRHKSLSFATSTTKNTDWRFEGLTELSDLNVRQATVTRDDRLILLEDDGVYEWEGDKAKYRTYFWRSGKVFAPEIPMTYKIIRIQLNSNDEVTVRVFADGRKVFERTVVGTRNMMLPTWAIGREWYYELEGKGVVGKFAMANLEGALR